MADELDKFVLEYVVETRDSLKRLEALTKKMDDVDSAAGKGKSGLKNFASGATDEFGKLIPGIDAAKASVMALTAEFGVAAVAVLAIGAGIKAVMNVNDQFNSQRKLGQDVGVSGLRVENYRRQFRRASGGRVDEDLANATIRRLQQIKSTAFTDPTRMNTESRQLHLMGIDVGARGTPVTTKDFITSVAKKFSGMDDSTVQGAAKQLGISQDAALAMKALGDSMAHMTDVSAADIAKRQESEEKLKEFNNEMATFDEKLKELGISLGEKLLPPLTRFIGLVTDLVDKLPKNYDKTVNKASDVMSDFAKHPIITTLNQLDPIKNVKDVFQDLTHLGDSEKETSSGKQDSEVDLPGGVHLSTKDGTTTETKDGKVVSSGPAASTDAPAGVPAQAPVAGAVQVPVAGAVQVPAKAQEVAKTTLAAANTLQAAADQQKAAAEKSVDDSDKQNSDALNTSDNMALAVNMFAGAVSTFSNAIDEKQAWAAWAGEIGRAAGLGSDPQEDKTPEVEKTYGKAAATQYDDIFEEAAKRYNVPVDLIKAHASVETGGTFKPDLTSSAGAQGIMQLMPEIQRAYGVADPMDARQSIMAGTQLIAENLKRYGNTADAIEAYHAGPNESGWGPKTRAYLTNVTKARQSYAQSSVTGDENTAVPNTTPVAKANYAPKSSVRGQSRDAVGVAEVQNNIAQRLGVPVNQIKQGLTNKGDVDWALSQLEGGVSNNIRNLRIQRSAQLLPQQEYSKLTNEIAQQQMGLSMLKTYGGRVVDQAQAGGQSITIGERAVIIQIDGSQNPEATGQATKIAFKDWISEIVNSGANGISH
jgi:soluble lytic murein transglycosylase-like protein